MVLVEAILMSYSDRHASHINKFVIYNQCKVLCKGGKDHYFCY